jgi:hypothetical protein
MLHRPLPRGAHFAGQHYLDLLAKLHDRLSWFLPTIRHGLSIRVNRQGICMMQPPALCSFHYESYRHPLAEQGESFVHVRIGTRPERTCPIEASAYAESGDCRCSIADRRRFGMVWARLVDERPVH